MSKGKPKPKIHNLSRTPPTTQEIFQVIDSLVAPADPIATAILGSVLVEHDLESLIRKRFRRCDESTWKEMISEKGPLSTFYAQITIGYALHIYDERTWKALNAVRAIRNQFAHAKRKIDFSHDLIVKELKLLKFNARLCKKYLAVFPVEEGARYAYTSLCLNLSIVLKRTGLRSLERSNAWLHAKHKAKAINASPLAQALTKSLSSPLPDSQEFSGQKIGDPTREPRQPYVRGLLDFLSKTESKTDK